MRQRGVFVLAVVVAAVACRERPIFSGTGTSFTERRQIPSGDSGVSVEETFRQPQEQARKVDILFVIDSSGSMADEQANLAANISAFINELTQSGANFQIGITTTDAPLTYVCDAGVVVDGSYGGDRGQLKSVGGNPKILTSSMSNVATLFQQNASQGTSGSGIEKGLEAMRLALSEPLISTVNSGFLRSDAAIAVIIVTDEDDCSYPATPTCNSRETNGNFCYTEISTMTSISEYATFLKNVKGGDLSKVLFAAIAGPDYPSYDVDGGSADAGGSPLLCRQASDCTNAGRRCIGGKCWPQTNERSTYRAYPNGPPYCFDSNLPYAYTTTCFMYQEVGPGQTLVPRDGGAAAGQYVCIAPGGNAGARAGTRYIDMVKEFGQNGFFGSICDANFSESLRQIGRGIVGLFCKVPLQAGYNIDPNAAADNPAGISVTIDGLAVPTADIRYNCPEPGNATYAKGSIQLADAYCQYPNPILAPGSTVKVNYTYRTTVISCTSDSECPGARCGRCGYCDDQVCEVGLSQLPSKVNQPAEGPNFIVKMDGGALPKDGSRFTYECPSATFPNGFIKFSAPCPRLAEQVEVLFTAREGNAPPACGTGGVCGAGATCGRCSVCE